MSDGERKRYRLEFYSTVCHRGQYVHSGHYVSIIWDRQLSQWLHFDDIAGEKITSSTPEYLLANETP
jgi:ubiquitin C-terminal hydrolase